MSKFVQYAFFLTLILILVAYWRGTANNINVFGEAINKILLTLSGRKAGGDFAAYPDGE